MATKLPSAWSLPSLQKLALILDIHINKCIIINHISIKAPDNYNNPRDLWLSRCNDATGGPDFWDMDETTDVMSGLGTLIDAPEDPATERDDDDDDDDGDYSDYDAAGA